MSDSITNRQDAFNPQSENDEPSAQNPPEAPARTGAGEAFSLLVVEIFRLNGLLLAAGDALSDPAGQTSARWRVLAAIEKRPLPVATIARIWGLARQSVQRIADLLVRDGLAVYEKNPSHRRAQLLVLTPKGLAALRSIQAAQITWANQLGAEIGENELRQALAILSQVHNIVSKR